ncbi:signal peptidase I [Thermodesulfobacteriota bacterium]
MEQTKRKSPIIAGLLSVALPGLGHIYCGKMEKGIAFFVGLWLLVAAVGRSGLITGWSGLIAGAVIILVAQIAIAVDAGLTAVRLKEKPPKKYSRWYVYVTAAMFGLLVFSITLVPSLVHQIIGLRTFKTQSSSMSPTLEPGDCFLTKLQRYGHRLPKRGDVVVYVYPEDRAKRFVHRVIGLPGERLTIKDKKVFINDKPLRDPWGVHNDESIFAAFSPRDNLGPVIIPRGSVFVMGDNRDFSHDSRYWGRLAVKDLRGKALFIYWSEDPTRIGTRLN